MNYEKNQPKRWSHMIHVSVLHGKHKIAFILFLLVCIATFATFIRHSTKHFPTCSPYYLNLLQDQESKMFKLSSKEELEHCRIHQVTSTGGCCLDLESDSIEINNTYSQYYNEAESRFAEALAILFGDKTYIGFGSGLGKIESAMKKNEIKPCHLFATDGAYGVHEKSDGKVKFLDVTDTC